MKPEDILSSLGELDDSFILEAEAPIRKRSYRGIITIIAAAAMLVCVSLIPLALSRNDEPVEPPRIDSAMLGDKGSYSDETAVSDNESEIPLESGFVNEDSSFSANENESDNQEIFEDGSKEITEEPSYEESHEDPSVEEPSVEEPSVEDSSTENLLPEEPSTEDPSTEDPSVEDPSVEDPSTEDPSTEDPSVEGDVSSGETSSGDSVDDTVSYDGPIYKVYDDYDGEPYEEPDIEPPNYVGTLDADKSKSLNMILSSLQTADNRVHSVSGSVSNVWDVLSSLGYNNKYIFQFKSTDRKHSYAIYEHDSDGTYVLQTFHLLYRVTPEEMADIRELIKHL